MVDNKLPRHLADLPVISFYVPRVIRRHNIASQTNNRNLALIRATHDGGESCSLVRRHNQQVGPRADEGLNLIDLLTVVLLRTGDDKIDIGLL